MLEMNEQLVQACRGWWKVSAGQEFTTDVLYTFHIALEGAQNGESVDMNYLKSTFGNN